MSAALDNPIFQDADKAREHLEAQRWPNGPICPHCGNSDADKITGLKGKAHRAGLYQCYECHDQFTVTVGSVMERSKIPLNKWLFATHLITSSKKGMSAHQMHRMLGVTYKTAWFLCHRIREMLREEVGPANPMGGPNKIIEADETYFGHKDDPTKGKRTIRGKRGLGGKRAVVALVERGGSVRSFHVETATKNAVTEILRTNVHRTSTLHSDESSLYTAVGAEFGAHHTVRHASGEYVRAEVHTNTIEGYFSVFKRGMKGVYQHCGEKHLHRYLAEFDFRYNNRTAVGVSDVERRDIALSQMGGKRLTYRRPHGLA